MESTKLATFGETLQTFYKMEENRMATVRYIFNTEINFSAIYRDGVKMIPVKNLKNLKLGIGKREYVEYSKAFIKFQNKMKEEKYARQFGQRPLMFVHN